MGELKFVIRKSMDKHWVVFYDAMPVAAFREWVHAVRFAHDVAR